MIDKTSIKRFEDLPVWSESQDFALAIYELTKTFPDDERYSLSNQMRRASSSISANIAEGFGRKSLKSKCEFYRIAYGSLLETKNFIYLTRKLGYTSTEKELELVTDAEMLQKQINAILGYFNHHD